MTEQFNYDHIKKTLRMDGKHHTCNAIEALERQLVEVRESEPHGVAVEEWSKRIRHAAGEFNNPSKTVISVIREMVSTINQLKEGIDTLRSDLARVTAELAQANTLVSFYRETLKTREGELTGWMPLPPTPKVEESE
jgi:chromosome segregation ATPase